MTLPHAPLPPEEAGLPKAEEIRHRDPDFRRNGPPRLGTNLWDGELNLRPCPSSLPGAGVLGTLVHERPEKGCRVGFPENASCDLKTAFQAERGGHPRSHWDVLGSLQGPSPDGTV